MAISVFIDNNVWGFLFKHGLDLSVELPKPFVEVTPSAMTELVHWQNQGYGLITPVVTDKKLSIEEIR